MMIGDGTYNPLLQTLILLSFMGNDKIPQDLKQDITKEGFQKYRSETAMSDVKAAALNQCIINRGKP